MNLHRTAIYLGSLTLGLNLTIAMANPTLRHLVDSCLGQTNPVGNPNIGFGCQELLVYFDPWFAIVLHVVFIIGIPLIPFALQPPGGINSNLRSVFCIATIAIFECLWLSQVFMCLFCRGPFWNFFWPWEKQNEFRVTAQNYVDVSQYVWNWWLSSSVPISQPNATWLQSMQTIMLRESVGMIVIGLYVIVGLFLSRYVIRKTGLYRSALAVLCIQLALLLPIKMALRTLFSIRYIIGVPEWVLNF